MRIEQLMSREPKTCRPTDTLRTAASLMWNADCGFVPVLADWGRLLGVITDRDICMAAALQDAKLSDLRVEGTMTRDVHSSRPNDTIDAAERLMETYQVRRLPVVDDAGTLVGVISVGDVAREARRQQADCPARTVSDGLTIETLATICTPRRGDPSAA